MNICWKSNRLELPNDPKHNWKWYGYVVIFFSFFLLRETFARDLHYIIRCVIYEVWAQSRSQSVFRTIGETNSFIVLRYFLFAIVWKMFGANFCVENVISIWFWFHHNIFFFSKDKVIWKPKRPKSVPWKLPIFRFTIVPEQNEHLNYTSLMPSTHNKTPNTKENTDKSNR